MKNNSSKTKYSWKTSLPAYLENAIGKDLQSQLILWLIKKMPGKRSTIKELQETLKKRFSVFLPQSTVSGRIGDLKQEGKIAHYGEIRVYKERKRKVYQVVDKRKKAIGKSRKPKFQKVSPVYYKKVSGMHAIKLSDGNVWRSKDGRVWAKKKRIPRKKSIRKTVKLFL